MRSWDNVSYVYDPLITYGYRLVVYKSALLAVYAYNHTVVYVYELKGAPRIRVLSCLQFSMVSPNFKHQIPFLCETPIAGLELIYRPMQIILPL